MENKNKQEDNELMNFAIHLASNNIDLEELFKQIMPILEIMSQVFKKQLDLAVKNYKFLKGGM